MSIESVQHSYQTGWERATEPGPYKNITKVQHATDNKWSPSSDVCLLNIMLMQFSLHKIGLCLYDHHRGLSLSQSSCFYLSAFHACAKEIQQVGKYHITHPVVLEATQVCDFD